MRLVLLAVAVHLFTLVYSIPVPSIEYDPTDNSTYIPVTDLYEGLSLSEVPTTFEEGIVFTRSNTTRYGYAFNRTPNKLLHFFKTPIGRVVNPIFGKWLNHTISFHHWGILISPEPPYNDTEAEVQQGKKVPSPETGLVFELRNSDNTGLVYLDVKTWQNYTIRAPKVRYLGPLTKNDIELVNIGRAYIKQVGREGFHNFYRNCQVFTTWYSKALWPDAQLEGRRADQLFGKLLWWFKDWGKTVKCGWDRVANFLGFRGRVEEVDDEVEFIPPEVLLDENVTHPINWKEMTNQIEGGQEGEEK
jgi:hypothetical protein